ncbi:hypothetical protein, partial [Sinorhizobium sp. Sb3]|uniref:hypothetical protein n=1 Tax=Sinorhizobium sp. Sb3 TaxID=1358417 RepID=UPI001AECEFB6
EADFSQDSAINSVALKGSEPTTSLFHRRREGRMRFDRGSDRNLRRFTLRARLSRDYNPQTADRRRHDFKRRTCFGGDRQDHVT